MSQLPNAAAAAAPLVFAYYVTGHGFGHATRVVEVARHLVCAGHEVHIVTGAPEFVFKREIPSSRLHIRKVLLDCGAVQSDALTVDRLASLEQYSQTAVLPRASILSTEAKWLQSIKANLVVSDIVPVACRAAAEAGIPSVCVTNFSWDFIYAEYVTAAGHHHQSIVWQIAEDYSYALFLIRLPGYCPMPAFRDVIDVPLVVRKVRRTKEEVRKEFGVEDDAKLLVLNFGGQIASWSLKEEFLPSGWKCVVCGASPKDQLPPKFIAPGRDAYTPDLIAASDCMLGKIGYGTVSEALAYKVPFVFVRRDYFNEEPFLRNMLEFYQGGVEMIRRDFLIGRWQPYLQRALKMQPTFVGDVNGGQVVANILQDAALGKVIASKEKSGARRLRDAIVFGYQMQRVPGRELGIPEWYTSTGTQLGLLPPLHPDMPHDFSRNDIGPFENIGVEDFEILHGELHGLSDTASFLRSLARLDADADPNERDVSQKAPVRERVAAAGLFRWEDELFVARAPGRLDVMGGIADYSGSLVLQMPIREACHVAVQRSPPCKQRLWRHVQARHLAKKDCELSAVQIVTRIPRPKLLQNEFDAEFVALDPEKSANNNVQIIFFQVSFGSELTNRAPTFDMDIADFLDENGEPISYVAARKYFSQDSSQKWASYVAGTILVLMREQGVQFHDGINILVSSTVPEGKGVSSSAALEVATMSAITAAYGLKIDPRDLAILCQKVENHIVGAPCGVMDQMTAACGEAHKLLAMVCQPAEVKEHVLIPSHVRFWGIDSGIKHSVGGADYGSVRVGAFMGRRIIQSAALQSQGSSLRPCYHCSEGADSVGDESDDLECLLLPDEANLDYLCNLQPHRFDGLYAEILPREIQGNTFSDTYGEHNDPVTAIDPKRAYPVKASTAHPIYENFRVKTFAVLLSAADSDSQLSALGELMYQSHCSYSLCGLGSDGTDRLVRLVKHMQKSRPSQVGTLFGAKITGGGSGGTVCVLGRDGFYSSEQIREIQQWYKEATGHFPYIFEGSSPGAGKFGYLKIRRHRR
ncbi:hypothetical protein O6H91_19G056700 [Diphasiastrum complanatum]|uniref:Uncharacterized protein n=1 Tax=Diphasiastrum complanatum TaxID=34168 RepID=A0ACC2AVI1_DIPCM|nr:hypothetical protein O6H91_19G056700 [Diphasiastrum complanatum]